MQHGCRSGTRRRGGSDLADRAGRRGNGDQQGRKDPPPFVSWIAMTRRVAVDDLIAAQDAADILHLAHRNTRTSDATTTCQSRPWISAKVASSSGFAPR